MLAWGSLRREPKLVVETRPAQKVWPDLTVDCKAWDLAKAQLGDFASLSEIAQRAQEIKDAL